MRIRFTVNNAPVTLDLPPHKRLLDVLREDLQIKETSTGCYNGSCGKCAVLLNNEIVLSCLVPVIACRDETIVTVEGFRKTEAYRIIMEGMKEADCDLCEECISERILAIHALIETNPVPDPAVIASFLGNNICGCVDSATLLRGIKSAAKKRRMYLHDRKK